jgi:DNA-binding MarR family transcriptional regulator
MDSVERLVVASVAVTARALNESAPDLTFAQWRVLVLVDRPDGMAVGAIAAALGAKIAAVSRLVGRLNRRGLVTTRRGHQDARIVLVALTAAGAELRNRVVKNRRIELADLLAEAGMDASAEPLIERLASVLGAFE